MTTPTDITLPHGVRFAEKWVQWVAYRKEIKKTLISPKAISGCLNQLKVVSEEDACLMIEQSIRAQYQGIFPLKKNEGKTDTPKNLSPPKQQTLSTYQATPMPVEERMAHIRSKLKSNFEKGTYIHDYGSVYTVLLIEKCGMLIHGDKKREIEEEVEHEATRTRNRFEERYSGNTESDIRDSKLNYWLDQKREEGVKVFELI